jgi:hypothetical protein
MEPKKGPNTVKLDNSSVDQVPVVISAGLNSPAALIAAPIVTSDIAPVQENNNSARPSASFDETYDKILDSNTSTQKLYNASILPTSAAKSSVPFKAIGIAAGLFALIIGLVALFYFGYYAKNKPTIVVEDAMTKLMNNKNTKNFELNRVTSVDGVDIGELTRKITLRSNNDYRYNTEIKSGDQVVSSSVIFKSTGSELYLKADNPKTLLKLYAYDQKPLEQASVDLLTGKWLRFDDISFPKNTSTPSVASNQVSVCLDGYKKYSSDNIDLAKNLNNSYKLYDNNYTKGSASNIDGVKTNVYKSNYGAVNSNTKTKELVDGFYNQQSGVLSACSISISPYASEASKSSIILNSATFDIDANRNILGSGSVFTDTANKIKNISRIKYQTQELDTSSPKDFVDAKVFTKDQATYSWLLAILRASVRVNIN